MKITFKSGNIDHTNNIIDTNEKKDTTTDNTIKNRVDDTITDPRNVNFDDFYNCNDYENYDMYVSDDKLSSEIKFVAIDKKIKTIDDLIDLGNHFDNNIYKDKNAVYDENTNLYTYNEKNYTIDPTKLIKLIKPLRKLNRMVGMDSIKRTMVEFITHYLQEQNHNQMLHTVIEGDPGVGKSRVGKIIAEIYHSLGITSSDRCIEAKRSDFIAKFSGQTADKTRKLLESANGGVIIVDEAYSLGTGDDKSYSRICLDVINDELEKMKSSLAVIFMGYIGSTKKYIFSHNEGLERRFPFVHVIKGYSASELKDIFLSFVKLKTMKLDKSLTEKSITNIFTTNKSKLKNYGGDIENIINRCCMKCNIDNFGQHPLKRKIITKKVLKEVIDDYKSESEHNTHALSIYT